MTSRGRKAVTGGGFTLGCPSSANDSAATITLPGTNPKPSSIFISSAAVVIILRIVQIAQSDECKIHLHS